MTDASYDGALSALEGIFGDRVKRGPTGKGEPSALAVVSPTSAGEVQRLAEVAGRFSVPLVGLGADTARETEVLEGSVLVRFDLMSGMRLPDSDEPWVEAEPGATLLSLENNLETRGLGLAVYPTSAPRATVGGWLAMDGIGVGSYEYGWLSENVLSADVVLPGGERRAVGEEDVRSVLEQGAGLTVSARLRTRSTSGDVPFAAAFEAPEDLAGAVADLFGTGVPLWHLAFLNPEMTRARSLGEDFLLFGAYPAERAAAVEEALADAFGTRGGRALPAADAHRAWGERFFPVAPSRPTPAAERALVPLTALAEVLGGGRDDRRTAAQGTVARSGEVLLLNLELGEGDRRG